MPIELVPVMTRDELRQIQNIMHAVEARRTIADVPQPDLQQTLSVAVEKSLATLHDIGAGQLKSWKNLHNTSAAVGNVLIASEHQYQIDSVLARHLDLVEPGMRKHMRERLGKGCTMEWFIGTHRFTPGFYTGLKADNNIITAKFKLNDDISWKGGKMNIQNSTIPDSMVQNLVGRRFVDVFDHPRLEPEAKILKARINQHGTLLLSGEMTVVDL